LVAHDGTVYVGNSAETAPSPWTRSPAGGNASGQTRLWQERLTEADVRTVVTDYYIRQGWHAKSGTPLAGTPQALDIADCAAFGADSASLEGGAATLPPIVLAEVGGPPQEQHQE
jgi:hypothetical protein